MEEAWFTDEEKFGILTTIVRDSVRGGTTKESTLSESGITIAEEGVDDGIFGKDESIVCEGCQRKYPSDNFPSSCEVCGNSMSGTDSDPVSVSYREIIWSDDIEDVLENSLEGFRLVFEKERSIEDAPVANLHPKDDRPSLHISPYYELESSILLFPGNQDAFLNWESIPQFFSDPDKIQKYLRDFLISGDIDLSKLKEHVGEIADVFYTGPGSPGVEYTKKTSWCTLLDRVEDKSEAHSISDRRFGINYNEMFERLGIEFLHTLFPHATTLHLGGKHVPDGILHAQKDDQISSYLVESKCKSSKFKIFQEQDKASRYIERFIRNVEGSTDMNYNINGYIFFAHEFDDNRMLDDMDSFVSLASNRNLNVICVNSTMMQEGMERLGCLYRREPSATYRIYKLSDWYRTQINGLKDYTRDYQTDSRKFGEEMLKVLEDMGHKKVSEENRIKEELEPAQTWEQNQAEAGQNIPDDYSVIT